jgi:hypothetical protein
MLRLQNDLGINMRGAALEVDLLGELNELRARIRKNNTFKIFNKTLLNNTDVSSIYDN